MTITLPAEPRTISGKQSKTLRQEGLIPAVLYGHEVESTPVQLKLTIFEKVFDQAGSATLVELELGGTTTPVLIHDVQYDPVKGLPLHADLFAVSMKEKLTTEIPLKFVGKSEAVEVLEGTLVENKDHLTVECLPTDLIPEIEVDLSRLKTFEDVVHVKDLTVPKTIEIKDDPEEVVVLVHPPKSEEELKAELEEPVKAAVEEIELSEERGKEETDGEPTAEPVAEAAGKETPQEQKTEKPGAKTEDKEKK